MEFLKENWYICLFVVFAVLYCIGAMIYMNKQKNKINKWFEENPTAAKVIVENKQKGIHSVTIRVLSVNGQPIEIYYEKGKQIIGLLPGTHVIQSTASSTRPGVMHKTVTKEYGPTNQEITVEANKTYIYDFDHKEERYTFNEK